MPAYIAFNCISAVLVVLSLKYSARFLLSVGWYILNAVFPAPDEVLSCKNTSNEPLFDVVLTELTNTLLFPDVNAVCAAPVLIVIVFVAPVPDATTPVPTKLSIDACVDNVDPSS